MVPTDDAKEEFSIYQYPKTVEDDPNLFPSVTRIIDGMLRNVDPINPVLVTYLSRINPDAQIGVFLPMVIEGTSKSGKGSNKFMKVAQPKSVPMIVGKEVSKPVQDPVPKDVKKEVVPSKLGVLK